MVRVWMADITPLLIEETYLKYYENVPAWRKEKADRLKVKTDQARSIGAWTLWNQVQEQEKLPSDTIYNLSHSGDYALCAYSDQLNVQVGCDVEEIKEARLSVARRYFCESEYQCILGQKNEEERAEMFYRFWVLKESFMKATRQGMALDMRTYEFTWNTEGNPELKKKPQEYSQDYYFREYYEKWIRARIAVCTTDPVIDPKIHMLNL